MTQMTTELPPGAREDDDRDEHPFFANPDDVSAETYPHISNISVGFLVQRVVRPLEPTQPEYVTLPLTGRPLRDGVLFTVAKWNLLWESAQFRRRFFADEDLPPEIMQLADLGDVNITFVPRTASRYYEYAPLFHLLSRSQVQRHGLPLLRPGTWPFTAEYTHPDCFLPADFASRLERAWAAAVWRHLSSRSPQRAFTASDPIRLLAHNLDFWIPPVTAVMQDILRSFPVAGDLVPEEPVQLIDGSFLDGAVAASPRMGGTLWVGEEWAEKVVGEVVKAADSHGRLRDILDAVRSNRVEDDFSNRWSFAREDFERKLYHKRNKVKVRFVELTDTIPVQGPETEVEGNIVIGDFLALLDRRERQIVVLLLSGVTRIGEVASVLGYKNHSPVSKRLARIRQLALEHLS
jgi:hypothetical protein